MQTGSEWVVDALGCDPARLADLPTLEALFAAIVAELDLHPVAAAQWHQFPPPGGITGLLMLRESHLSCHTFPEHGALALNLYCCRPREGWDWERGLARFVAARQVGVRALRRGAMDR